MIAVSPAQLKNKGVSLHFIDLGASVSNGIWQLTFTILSAVAEKERGRIKERISEAKSRMRNECRYLGGRVAFGYRPEEDRLAQDEAQQRCISMLKRKRASGLSLRQLSQYASREWGMTLSHNAIRNILNGEKKLGSISLDQAH